MKGRIILWLLAMGGMNAAAPRSELDVPPLSGCVDVVEEDLVVIVLPDERLVRVPLAAWPAGAIREGDCLREGRPDASATKAARRAAEEQIRGLRLPR